MGLQAVSLQDYQSMMAKQDIIFADHVKALADLRPPCCVYAEDKAVAHPGNPFDVIVVTGVDKEGASDINMGKEACLC